VRLGEVARGGVANGWATHGLHACSAPTQVDWLATKHHELPSPESWQPHALETFTPPLMQVVSSDVQRHPAPSGAGWDGGAGAASVGTSMRSRAISQWQLRLPASYVGAALAARRARSDRGGD
jgi:hypothetical protein